MNLEKTPKKKAPCKTHKIQSFMPVSPILAEKIKKEKRLNECDLHKLKIYSEGQTFNYIVDSDFLNSFMNQKSSEGNVFYDRDKKNKLLNDRLLVQQIVSQMEWVCVECFNDLVNSNEEV